MTTANQDQTEVMPDEYKDAFNEVAGPGSSISDDDAMGISTPASEAAVAAVEGEEVPVDPAATEATDPNAPAETVQNVATETAADALPVAGDDADDEADMTPRELQRKRSWEGRLKKMESDLKAVADQNKARPAEEVLAAAVESAEPGADPVQQQAADEQADADAGQVSRRDRQDQEPAE